VPQKVMPFPRSLALWLEQSAITVWYSVPSALVRLSLYGVLERSNLSTLRRVLFAGEVFPIRHLRGLMQSIPHASFHNLYGPTETNVCTMFDVPAVLPADWLSLPIGRACSGDQVLALDDSGRPAGPGAIGELCVQGPSLMSGYWGDADRTARVLVRDLAAFDAAAQVYRTGDYVTRDGDGNWCFVGRRDLQVKSRGYRIELGEVESVLHLHPAVEEAVVLPEPHDEFGCTLRALVVLAAGRQAIASELLGFCATRLPDYMLPAKIEVVDRFPRTSSGKTDRVALAG